MLEHTNYTALERLTQCDHCRPWACQEGKGDMELQLHSFLTSVQDKFSVSRSVRFTPGKIPGNPEGRGVRSPMVIGIFHWHNPSGRAMALGSTQPLTEMSTREYFLGGKGGQRVGLTTLPRSCAECLEIWKPLNLLEPSGPVQDWNGKALAFTPLNRRPDGPQNRSEYLGK
jgi:hypothetical protein